MLAVVGFVPCADKHRVKEAPWQRFVWSLTLNRDVCSDSVLHLTLVERAPMDRARRKAFATDGAHPFDFPQGRLCRAPPALHRPARDFFRCFSRSGKGDSMTSAMNVAERPRSRVLVAPHQVPPEARRTKKSAASDQVQSFAAKRAP